MTDVERVLATRHANGADYWATADGRLYVGSPFSTLTSLVILHELGVTPAHEAVRGGLQLIFNACRNDGAIRLARTAPLYPCYTAEALRVLCRYGAGRDPRAERTAAALLESAHHTGGWRCQFTKFGKGPETRVANPGATLFVLDALRFWPRRRTGPPVDAAVDSLLDHWTSRTPTGPCHYGIGTLFFQVEYPFLRYNLFYWVYVLSFFERARRSSAFREARDVLEGKLDPKRRVIVERPHRALKDLELCRRGEPSAQATTRYREILKNCRT